MQVHQWHGARVVRLTVPAKDWGHHQEASVEAFCRRWFAQERFDLVHAHCIQALGVGPLQVARQRNIPHAVTLHDGWWLFPRQFLVTPSGRPVQLTDPLSHFEAAAAVDEAERRAALERRKSLANVLAAAAARWAVSEAFAAVHREAGVNDVAVMENRWQPMHTALGRAPQPGTQPLRCCFIGGVAMHKGMAVLQTAVLRAKPASPGLQLTVVDSKLQAGDGFRTTWGQTPVQVVPAVPMDQMAEFYASQDVLIAPSIWPRELWPGHTGSPFRGLWVVAVQLERWLIRFGLVRTATRSHRAMLQAECRA